MKTKSIYVSIYMIFQFMILIWIRKAFWFSNGQYIDIYRSGSVLVHVGEHCRMGDNVYKGSYWNVSRIYFQLFYFVS